MADRPPYADVYLQYREGEDFPFAYAYPRSSVTADCIVFSRTLQETCVLLIRRGASPYKDCWAFPGGFLETGLETIEQCARRELMEETGLEAGQLTLVGVFSKPGRDPRGPVVTAAYSGFVEMQPAKGGDDAAEARWFPINEVPSALAFDHSEMLSQARAIMNI